MQIEEQCEAEQKTRLVRHDQLKDSGQQSTEWTSERAWFGRAQACVYGPAFPSTVVMRNDYVVEKIYCCFRKAGHATKTLTLTRFRKSDRPCARFSSLDSRSIASIF
jgi:hypothetical protein